MKIYSVDMDAGWEPSDVLLIPEDTILLRVNFNKYRFLEELTDFFCDIPESIEILDLSENDLCRFVTCTNLLASLFSNLTPNIRTIYLNSGMWPSFNQFPLEKLKILHNTLPHIHYVKLASATVNLMSKEALDALREIFPNAYNYEFLDGETGADFLLYSPKTYYLQNRIPELMHQARFAYLVLNKNKLPEALIIATLDYLYTIPINANEIKPMFIFKQEKHTSITLNKELLALTKKPDKYNPLHSQRHNLIFTLALALLIYKVKIYHEAQAYHWLTATLISILPLSYLYRWSSLYLGQFTKEEQQALNKSNHNLSFFAPTTKSNPPQAPQTQMALS